MSYLQPDCRSTRYSACAVRLLGGTMNPRGASWGASMRNKMAHHLDPGDLDELLGSAVEKLGSGYADRLKTPIDRFRVAAFYACGYFDAIRGSIRLTQAYAPEDEV
jgi:hypothetical protein